MNDNERKSNNMEDNERKRQKVRENVQFVATDEALKSDKFEIETEKR